MQDRLVSIIVPVYNVSIYLAEALDSVLAQTYGNLEVIVVDDGSTDGSSAICDEYARRDMRVTVIHQRNMGLSAARNVGLDIMRGDVVAFIDPDDVYSESFVEMMMESLSDTGADMAVCRYEVRYPLGPLGKKRAPQVMPRIAMGTYGRIDALRALADGSLNVTVWNKIYDRDLWDNVRFPDGQVYEDVSAVYEICSLSSKVCVLNQALYLYRKRPDGITMTTSIENSRDFLASNAYALRFIEEHTPEVFTYEQFQVARMSGLYRMMGVYVRHLGDSEDEGKAFRRGLRQQVIELGQEIDMKGCPLKTRFAYWSICNCSWLLWIIYPLYHVLRVAMFELAGR